MGTDLYVLQVHEVIATLFHQQMSLRMCGLRPLLFCIFLSLPLGLTAFAMLQLFWLVGRGR